MASSCKAQKLPIAPLSKTDYEVLNKFVMGIKPYSYLDSEIKPNKDLMEELEATYAYLQGFYESMDKQCGTATDTIKLKFSCSMANALKKFDGLLTVKDFDYIRKSHKNQKQEYRITFDEIENPKVQQHSSEFYRGGQDQMTAAEFPSIGINFIAYTEDGQIAVIGYLVRETHNHGFSDYFVLQKKKNLWWKPLGNLRL